MEAVSTCNYCCDHAANGGAIMILVSTLIVGIACLLNYYFTRTFSYWRDRNVVGPSPIPILGNLKKNVLRRTHIGIVYKEIYDEFPNEKIIGFYRMTNPSVIIRDLDIIKQILIKDFDYFSERGIEFSKEGLGDNLFHCDINTWQALRNRLTPIFTSGKLNNNFHLIDEYANQLVNYIEAITCEDKEQETYSIFKKYAMGSVMSVVFGLAIDFFKDDHGTIEKAGSSILRSTYATEMDLLFPKIWKKLNLSFYPELVNKFCYEVVKTVVDQRKGKPTIRNDLIDVLLTLRKEGEIEGIKQFENGKQLGIEVTDHVMAGQVFIFFGAGFGNISLSLSYTLFRLAKHQEIQDKLIQEVDDVLAKYDGKLTYDGLKEMTYLDKVFCEVLRMNALTNAVQRTTKKNYKVPGSDVVIEKGTPVIISPYAIHRDPELYPNPDNFDPERFSRENSANRHPCAYLPFGAGPRSCIGRQLAKLHYLTAIVKILSKFRVEPSEKTKIIEDYEPMSTQLATRGGIYVNIVPRT